MNKKVFALIIIAFIIFFFFGCSIEYERTSYNEENNVKTEVKDLYERKIYTKDELKNMLLSVLEKKNYSELTDSFILEIFDNLYKNYPKWKETYKDLPDISLYMIDNLLNPLDKIINIELYQNGSKESIEIGEIGSGYTYYNENDELSIKLIYEEYENKNEPFHVGDIEGLFHEIIHAKQLSHNIIIDTYYNDDKTDTLYKVFMEGGATFNERFISEYDTNAYAFYVFCKSDNSECLQYDKETGQAVPYLLYMNSYEKMVYLLGYETMNKYEKGLISDKVIEKMLKERTGKDILSIIALACNEKEETKEKLYENSLLLEKIFLEEIKKDISKLNSYNDVKKYIEIYRRYKIKSFPRMSKSKNMFHPQDDIFNNVFNIDEIDIELINKILQFNVMKKISSNEKLNKMAIKSLLMANKYKYYEYNNVYESLSLPFHLNDVRYNYTEKGSKGHLLVKYNCKFCNTVDYVNEVYLEFTFDSSKILSIKGYNPQKISNKKIFNSVFN